MTVLKEELVSQRGEIESYLEAVSGIRIVLIDSTLKIVDCNQGFTRMFQLQQKPIGSPLTDFLIFDYNDLKQTGELKLTCNKKSSVNVTLYCHAVATEKGYLLFCERLIITESQAIEQIGVINNELINLQRELVKKNLFLEKLKRELDERIAELEVTITALNRAEAEKTSLEAQNIQLQKAESLGRMAGAIAHHFNNQLAVVIGNLELAMLNLPQEVNIRENITFAMEASNKAAEMSGLMLTYLGQSLDKRKLLDLSEVCLRNLPLLQAAIPGNVVLETDLPSPGPLISTSANYIQLVMTNLIINAWESIGESQGTIRMNVKKLSLAEIPTMHRFPIDWQPQDNAYACLEVKDEGCGITYKDIEKIFDPFFTSKFTGRGMGLAVAMGIVRTHKGVITVESELNRGSTFRVFFPISREKGPRYPDKVVNDGDVLISVGSQVEMEEYGTVLIVDDEKIMRKMAAALLKSLGFTVLEAKDGVEAVEVFRQHQNEIRFVLCDLTMPRMNGWETLTALRKLVSDVPLILACGYDKEQVVTGDHPEMPQAFLRKPYSLKGLSIAIRQALNNKKKLKF